MPTINFGCNLSGGGMSIARSTPRAVESAPGVQVDLPTGKTGTVTTRTDANTGELTLAGGHGITDGLLVDVYWAGGRRFGMLVGTVVTNVVPIDGGAGDDLPSTTTPVVCTKQVTVNAAIDGDELAILGVQVARSLNNSEARAHLSFQESDNSQIANVDVQGNEPQIWDIAGGSDNPFAGDPIAKIKASNGSSSEAATLKLIFGQDVTP